MNMNDLVDALNALQGVVGSGDEVSRLERGLAAAKTHMADDNVTAERAFDESMAVLETGVEAAVRLVRRANERAVAVGHKALDLDRKLAQMAEKVRRETESDQRRHPARSYVDDLLDRSKSRKTTKGLAAIDHPEAPYVAQLLQRVGGTAW